MDAEGFLHDAIVYLGAAVVAVPITSRLGLGSAVGYIAAGIAIGPAGLGLITEPANVLRFAELGVVLLLFLIGLELNPSRLWDMRRPIFGMGSAQVLATTAAFALAGALAGNRLELALVAGMGFAMSSTALALQLLRERNLHALPPGEAAFGVLLFQDLSVIPMLSLLPLLARASGAEPVGSNGLALRFVIGIAAIVGVVLLGRFVVRPLFRIVAATRLREMFTALALFLILGTALAMQKAGLSMALGTFLAGVLLAESEYRHELEVDIEPFKGILLGLFFVAVGMTVEVRALLASPAAVLATLAALLAIKVAVLLGVARAFGLSTREATVFALALSQGGEFAFVLFGLAGRLGIIEPRESGILNLAVALSMAATPFLFIAYEALTARRQRAAHEAARAEHAIVPQHNPVILAGYGRIGQVIGRLLHAQKIGVTILEQDPAQIEVVRRFGYKTFYGDVSRLDLLEAAGAAEAKLLILAIDDMDAATRVVKLVRERFPALRVLVRAESRLDAYAFINLSVPVVRATWAPGIEMGREALRLLGVPAFEAHRIVQRFDRIDRAQLPRQAAFIADEGARLTMWLQSREELHRIMESDEERREKAAEGAG